MAQNIATSNNIDGVRLEQQGSVTFPSSGYTQLQMLSGNIAWAITVSKWLYGVGNLIRTTDPGASNDGYPVGTTWTNTADNRTWVCTDGTLSNAVWQLTGGELFTQVGLTANTPIANNSSTDIDWDVVEDGETSWWASSPNPDRITPNRAGIYEAYLFVRWSANDTGQRLLQIFKNGVQIGAIRKLATGPSETIVYVSRFSMNGTSDYITGRVFQNSGGSLDVINNSYLVLQFKGAS